MAKLIEITGKALSGEWGNDDNTGNGIPVLRTTNFTNEGIVNYNNVVTRIIEKKKIEEKYLRKGDIIIEKSGGSDKQPVGRVVYFDGPENTYLFNNFTGLLRVKDQAKWYPRYVFYSLFSNYHRGGTRAFQNKTTGLHNLKIDDFVSRCEVTEAGINEQIAACKQMDRVNDIIRMHQQQLQKLDELVKARFVEMFGDRWANNLEWPQKPLKDCATFYNGKAHEQVVDEHGEYILVTSKCIASDQREYRRTNTLLFPLQCGDICMVMSDVPNGRALAKCMMITEDNRYTLNQRICCLRGYSLHTVFFMHVLNRHEYLLSFNDGDSQTNLRKDDLLACPIILPPVDLQEQFAAFVEQVDESKVAVQKALDEAQLLFDSLMQKYFG